MRRRLSVLLAVSALGCAPAAQPLKGILAPEMRLPPLQLSKAHRQNAFRWELTDGDMVVRGEGSVRTAYPDSARLDFFLGGIGGGGAAILIGDSLISARQDMVRRFLPPLPLMWAALGRLAIPALRDTTVRMDGAVLRADVGRPQEWRIAALGDTLIELQHISAGHIAESLTRSANGSALYEVPSARRKLKLTVTNSVFKDSFDASIWTL